MLFVHYPARADEVVDDFLDLMLCFGQVVLHPIALLFGPQRAATAAVHAGRRVDDAEERTLASLDVPRVGRQRDAALFGFLK
ncbi:MAG: hypothetical protein BWY76_02947 [bacterium ADurb.Bin429]|nr:MAG: hypothetical protein BWY76_02947 [bacterium ADurb.Bin429]